jgi:hypothetical protein
LFFFVIEVRITCSHCPYYAKDEKFLNCPGNNFFPKIWKYNPKPISIIEQIGSILGFGLLGLIPLISEIYGIFYAFSAVQDLNFLIMFGPLILLIVTIISYFIFISFFLLNFCPKCLNFSCRFNKVPQVIIDEYCKKNPIIRDVLDKNNNSKGK